MAEATMRTWKKVTLEALVADEVVKLGDLAVGETFVLDGDETMRVYAAQDNPAETTSVYCLSAGVGECIYYTTPVRRIKVKGAVR